MFFSVRAFRRTALLDGFPGAQIDAVEGVERVGLSVAAIPVARLRRLVELPAAHHGVGILTGRVAWREDRRVGRGVARRVLLRKAATQVSGGLGAGVLRERAHHVGGVLPRHLLGVVGGGGGLVHVSAARGAVQDGGFVHVGHGPALLVLQEG